MSFQEFVMERGAIQHPNRHPNRSRFTLLLAAAGLSFSMLAGARSASASVNGPDEPSPLAMFDDYDPPVADRRKIELFSDVVLNPSSDIDAETRRGMVEELLKIGRAEALQPLHEALISGRAVIMLPVIEVLNRLPTPEPRLLGAIVQALSDAPDETVESLAMLIGQYGQRGFERIAPFAKDRELDPERRLASIRAIASFRGRESVDLLMSLVDPQRDEPEAIRAEAFESLRRLTGLDFDGEYHAWRDWWAEARELDSDEWLKQMIRSMTEQITATEKRLNEERQAGEAVAARLAETLRQLYQALPDDEQFPRLTRDLRDPMPVVREAAADRLARLMRDSVRLPEEVQAALVERLNDEAPALRRKAARMLDELNYDGIGARLADQLADESSPRVAAELLAILANRPTAHAAESAVRWLTHPEVQSSAVTALWRLVERDQLEDESAVLDSVREAYDQQPAPGIVRLLAALGSDEEADHIVETYLDHDEPAWRIAAAEGLRRREARDALLARADDPVIYPVAVAALTDLPPGLDVIDQLLALPPVENGNGQSNAAIWSSAILDVADDMPPHQLAEIDDRLRDADDVDRDLRIEALTRIEDAEQANELEVALYQTLTVRLATMLCDDGQADRAYGLIEQFRGAAGSNGDDGDSAALTTVRFRASMMTDRYDTAYRCSSELDNWIDLLDEIAPAEPALAARIIDEIHARFAERLQDGPATERIEKVRQSLPEDVLTNAPDGNAGP